MRGHQYPIANVRLKKAYYLSILPFNNELVLQHDQIAFSHLILHQTFQPSAQRVEKVSCPGLCLIGREEADPSETGNYSAGFKFIGELGHFLDACD